MTNDLFDDEPAPNSPEDLGAGWTPRAEKVQPWHTAHPEHPSRRPGNAHEAGESAPERWNVATTDLGIVHMRKFLTWCSELGIDTGEHTVGSLYVALNAHSLNSFRWLMTAIKRSGRKALPSTERMNAATAARDAALLYAGDEANRRTGNEQNHEPARSPRA